MNRKAFVFLIAGLACLALLVGGSPARADDPIVIPPGGVESPQPPVEEAPNVLPASPENQPGGPFDVSNVAAAAAGDAAARGNFVVNSDATAGWQDSSDVAVAPDGRFLVVWSGGQAPYDIQARLFDAGGAPAGPTFTVNPPVSDRRESEPDVAVDANGNFYVVYLVHAPAVGGTSQGIYLRRVTAAGAPIGPEVRLDQTSADYQLHAPHIGMARNSNGAFVVVWWATGYVWPTGDVAQLSYRLFDDNSQPLAGQQTVVDGEDDYDRSVGVSRLPDGSFVIVWYQWPAVTMQHFDATGTPLTDKLAASANGVSGPGQLAIANDGAGLFLIVWVNQARDGYVPDDGLDLYHRFYDATTGEMSEEPELLNDWTLSNQTSPSIDYDGQAFLVAWQTDANPVYGWATNARRMYPNGHAENEFTVSQSRNSYVDAPAVGANDSGNTVVTWGGTCLLTCAPNPYAAPDIYAQVGQLPTTTRAPTHDAYVKQSNPTANYGKATKLFVEEAANDTYSFLKFNLSGVTQPVGTAQLWLYVPDSHRFDGATIYSVSPNYRNTTTAWTETGLTWNNAPTLSPDKGVDYIGYDPDFDTIGEWKVADVTPAVRQALAGNGILSLGLKKSDPAWAGYSSYSSREGANPPRLVIDHSTLGYQRSFVTEPGHDTYVLQSTPKTSYSGQPYLAVRNIAGAQQRSYLKFFFSDPRYGVYGEVLRATLRLRVADPSPNTCRVSRVSDNYRNTTTGWQESGLTWKNAPTTIGPVLGTVNVRNAGEWVEVDVTAAVRDMVREGKNRVSFGLTSSGSNLILFDAWVSREGTNGPRLEVYWYR